ncbi:putative tetratricopeptide repeat protein 41 [Microcaecilia unicolor]|uniref:Tetratricopeptide repeat protein 41 n=1 Tax=Microcaecilia unicolor TaxID=1415580 RepID=A0A6P7Z5Z9_9AMPH|nr:putative tetratricopeptide repeat protein 41 [Microcaecilia unicolor]
MSDLQNSNHKIEEEQEFYFTDWPSIQPYICSTTKDFQEEKDYLTHNIFPKLNQLCRTRGTYFKAVDLRKTAEEQPDYTISSLHEIQANLSSQQLKLCLDYISISSPFFICMLGHTYGEFRPENSKLLFADSSSTQGLSKMEQNLYVAANNGYPWVLHEENQNCSTTELEIIQATLRKDTEFHYFYFRDYSYIGRKLEKVGEKERERILSNFTSESDYEEMKIRRLKVRIINRGLSVRFFKDLQELGDLILKDWSAIINKMYPAYSEPDNIGHEHNLQHAYHEAFAENLRKVFVPSKESKKIFELLDIFVMGNIKNENDYLSEIQTVNAFHTSVSSSKKIAANKSVLLLCGDRGCGKSSLIAVWVKAFKQKHPTTVILPYYVGSSGCGDDIMSFMRHCIIQLRCEYFGTLDDADAFSENSSDMWVFPLVVGAFLAAVKLKPCILVLDGIDELTGIHGQSTQQVKDFSWLPDSLPPHLKFIITTTSSCLSYQSLIARSDVRLAEVVYASNEDTRISIFQQQLSMPCKDILHCDLRSITSKKEIRSPLQLAILASELRVCGMYRKEMECLGKYLQAVSIQELLALVYKRWVEDYSWAVEKKKKNKKRKVLSTHHIPDKGLKGWVVDVLCLISVSRCGLAEHDILQLLNVLGYKNEHEVTSLHWAAFRAATFKWIQEKPDGLLCFHHQSLKEAVEYSLLGVITPVNESCPSSFQNPMNHKKTALHQVLIQYFQKQKFSRRTYQELPWHIKMTGSWKELYNFLSSPRTIDLLSKNARHSYQMKLDFMHYWQVLAVNEYDPAVAYLSMMHSLTADHSSCETVSKDNCIFTEANQETPRLDTIDKVRLISSAATLLKDIGKSSEGQELFLAAEALLLEEDFENHEATEVLFKLQTCIGEVYLEIGQTEEGYQYLQKAWDTLGHIPPNYLKNKDAIKQKGKLLCFLTVLMLERCSVEGFQMLEETLSFFKLFPTRPFERARLQLFKGLQKFFTGFYSKAKICFQACLNIRCSLYGTSHILVGEVQEYLADLLSHQKNAKGIHRRRAIENYKEVVKIKEGMELLTTSLQVRKQLRLSLSNTLYKLGELLHSQPGFHVKREVAEILRRSLDYRICCLGFDHPLTFDARCLLKKIETENYDVVSWIGSTVREADIWRQERLKWSNKPQNCITARSSVIDRAMGFQRTKSTELFNPSNSENVSNNLPGKRYKTPDQQVSTQDYILQQNHVRTAVSSRQDNKSLSEQTSIKSPESALSKFSWSPHKRATSVMNHSQSSAVCQPITTCQTSLIGPHSTVESLVTLGRPEMGSGSHRVLHRSAWYHVPGRYPTPRAPLPPKRYQIRREVSKKRGWLNNSLGDCVD